jgi:hypothetical protein
VVEGARVSVSGRPNPEAAGASRHRDLGSPLTHERLYQRRAIFPAATRLNNKIHVSCYQYTTLYKRLLGDRRYNSICNDFCDSSYFLVREPSWRQWLSNRPQFLSRPITVEITTYQRWLTDWSADTSSLLNRCQVCHRGLSHTVHVQFPKEVSKYF